MHLKSLLCLIPPLCLVGCAANPPLPTVDHVELPRYMGRWYEIARLPQSYERGCVAATADYSLRPDGKVDILNACRQGSPEGPPKSAKGTARVVDPATNAKLKVTFFWPFEGDYWILRLTPDYSAVAVGSPDRKSLWFLSRTPTMDPQLQIQWEQDLHRDGFPVEKMEHPPHAR